MGQFVAALLSTCIRPSALMNRVLGDRVDPLPAETQLGEHYVLLRAPQERGERMRPNTLDETVLPGDAQHLALGAKFKQLQDFRRHQHPEPDETEPDRLPFSPFMTRGLLPEGKASGTEIELNELVKTPYEERHSGATRDVFLLLRTRVEVQRRGHRKSPASLRNFERAGRLAKPAEQVSALVMASVESTRLYFDTLFQSGVVKGQLGTTTRAGAAFSGGYHL